MPAPTRRSLRRWEAANPFAIASRNNLCRPLLYRIAGQERFERLERLVHRGGAPFLLGVRLIPIMPFSLMGYVCGAARIPLWRFTWTTAIGYAPLTAYFTYVGSRLEGFSAEDPIVWIGGIVLIVCIFGVRFILPSTTATDSASGK